MVNNSQRDAIIVALADTEESRRTHHRLRYQVYCEELDYEDACRFPDGEERDRFDENAVRFVAYDGRTQNGVGALRLIPPSADDLPLLSVAGITGEVLPLFKDRRVAELSRMCVPAQVRKNAAALSGLNGTNPPQNERDTALVFFALVRASIAYAFHHGIEYLAFLTSSSLSRLLGRLGIKDHCAGAACNHRGVRSPRIVDVTVLFKALFEARSNHLFITKLASEFYLPHSVFPAVFRTEQARAACG